MEQALRDLRKKPFRERFFGDKAFYKMVLSIVLPMIVQNGITTFVGLLDNIMVGRIGTEAMSGTSIANQLFFVYNISLFGGLSGAGIFTVQYFGKGDIEGVRTSVRYKYWLTAILTIAGMAALFFFQTPLISLYLNDDGNPAGVMKTLAYAKEYTNWILVSLPAFAVSQIYSSTLRECGETRVPMTASVIAVGVNCLLNYILIFGKLGFPVMEVKGAAIATVISRYIEAAIVVIWPHRHEIEQKWAQSLYRTMRVPLREAKRIFLKGTPLLLNEVLWSIGTSFVAQCYSMRGLEAIAANNIAGNVSQLANIIYMSMGATCGIIVGQLLGAGEMVKAKDTDNKLIMFTMLLSLLSTALLFIIAPLFPRIYNTSDEIRAIAASIIRVSGIFCIQSAFLNDAYFTMRAGGQTWITFWFDCGGFWIGSIPVAFIMSRFTACSLPMIVFAVDLANIIKAVIGYILLRKNAWINNIVS